MELNCEIIRDLLPLYCDGVCSHASSKAVENHLNDCEICKKTHEALIKDSNFSSVNVNAEKNEAKFIRDVKSKIKLRKIIISVVSAAISAAVIFGIYTLCTVPSRPIAYSEDAFTVKDIGDMIAISYNGEDYQQIKAVNNITATIDGEEKVITCIWYNETISSKYFTSGDNRRKIEDGGDMAFSKKDRDYIYYLEEGCTPDEVVDAEALAEKVISKGDLMWQAE